MQYPSKILVLMSLRKTWCYPSQTWTCNTLVARQTPLLSGHHSLPPSIDAYLWYLWFIYIISSLRNFGGSTWMPAIMRGTQGLHPTSNTGKSPYNLYSVVATKTQTPKKFSSFSFVQASFYIKIVVCSSNFIWMPFIKVSYNVHIYKWTSIYQTFSESFYGT